MSVAAAGGRRYGTRWYPPYARKTDRSSGSFTEKEPHIRLLIRLMFVEGKSQGKARRRVQEKFGLSRASAYRLTQVMKGSYDRQSLKRLRHIYVRLVREMQVLKDLHLLLLRTHPRHDNLRQASGWDSSTRPERGPPSRFVMTWDGLQAVPVEDMAVRA